MEILQLPNTEAPVEAEAEINFGCNICPVHP